MPPAERTCCCRTWEPGTRGDGRKGDGTATGGGSDVAHGRGDRARGMRARGLWRRRGSGSARRAGDEHARGQRRRRARARGRRARRAGRGRRRRAAHAPAGVADAAFSTLYAARASDGRTTVEAIDIASGEVRASRVLDGTWELPRLGPAGTPIGLSPGGATLVLAWRPGEDEQAAFRREDRWQSRFALLPASLDRCRR